MRIAPIVPAVSLPVPWSFFITISTLNPTFSSFLAGIPAINNGELSPNYPCWRISIWRQQATSNTDRRLIRPRAHGSDMFRGELLPPESPHRVMVRLQGRFVGGHSGLSTNPATRSHDSLSNANCPLQNGSAANSGNRAARRVRTDTTGLPPYLPGAHHPRELPKHNRTVR